MDVRASMMAGLVAAASVSTVVSAALNPRPLSIAAMSLASLTQPLSQLAMGRWANWLMPTHSARLVMSAPWLLV